MTSMSHPGSGKTRLFIPALCPDTSSPWDLEDMRDVGDTLQGVLHIVPKKPSGGCSVDINQHMELTLAGTCSVSAELKD